MPSSGTRKRYVAIEVKARSTERAASVAKEAIVRWSRWTKQQKAECITNLDRIDDSTDEAKVRRETARNLIDDWDDSIFAKGQDLNYLSALRSVCRACQASMRADYTLQQALATAAAFYNDRGCPQEVVTVARTARLEQDNVLLASVLRFGLWRRRLGTLIERGPLGAHQQAVHDEQITRYGVKTILDRNISDNIPDHAGAGTIIEQHYPEATECDGPMLVYQGDHVLVSAWRFFDDEGDIVASAIRKDVDIYQPWTTWWYWLPDVRDMATRQLNEIYVHRMLCDVPNHPVPGRNNIIQLLEGSVDQLQRNASIWTEVATHGTLASLINAFHYRNLENGARIPEAFIWYVALTLVECGLVMERGTLDPDAPSPEGWEQVVHRDIKPDNILLCAPISERFPGYPQPRLGDFGCAILTYPGDPKNPEAHDEIGTHEWQAPEQERWRDENHKPYRAYPLSSKTDVHAVGLVIQRMMLLDGIRNVVDTYPRNSTPEFLSGFSRATDPSYYSMELRRLQDRCLRTAPDDRATFRELHTRIVRVLSGRRAPGTPMQTVRDIFAGRIDVSRQREHAVMSYDSTWQAVDRLRMLPWHRGDQRFTRGGLLEVPVGSIGRGSFKTMRRGRNEPITKIGYGSSWSVASG